MRRITLKFGRLPNVTTVASFDEYMPLDLASTIRQMVREELTRHARPKPYEATPAPPLSRPPVSIAAAGIDDCNYRSLSPPRSQRNNYTLPSFRQTTAELSLTAVRAALALSGVSPVLATPNQVTGYDLESLQIIQMDTAQTETPLPTKEEYLKDMLRVWRGRKNAAVASRDARAPAAKQQAASRPQQAQGKNAPSVTSQRAKQLQ
ncbi:hypothetical protein HPB51_025553 [Rhipicephalus microplus]|uniref:Uncharacterized protein n=1 Tax=Rhipicephalus microplus TaxID=6941 RepID=A0A9J6F8M9_RHIMP|nr:hypothetical protein HPB51_025553 [Rhipicephalus microplus]